MIPVSKPWLTELESKYVNEALSSGWISSNGPFIDRFEEKFAEYLGIKHAISTCNGTAACHIALAACGVDKGHRVAVPAMTFVATANAVTYCGAEVVGIDIEPTTWNMCPMKLANEYHNGNRPFEFVFQVHLYGNIQNQCVNMGCCTKTTLIEDACEALGGEWMGKKAGTWGKAAAFSFFGSKTLSTGEGGMVVTNDDEVANKARLLRGQGQTHRYYHEVVGYNYRMTNIQAALGLAQIERINDILAEKRRVYERYESRIGHLMQVRELRSTPSYWAVTAKVGNPEQVSSVLVQNGIETRRTFYPLSSLPMYEYCCPHGAKESKSLRDSGLTLPSYPELSNREVDIICDLVDSAMNT
jgi:perosamine synthetase